MKLHSIFVILLTLVAAASGRQVPATGWRDKPAATQSATQRVKLTPELKAEQTMRYQLDFRTTSDVRREGLAENPQGGGAVELRFSSTVNLEVLGVAPVRVRVTYEKSAATVRGDSLDASLAALEQQFARLEGRWLILTLDAAGKVTAVEGLEGFTTDARTNADALQALSKMFTSPAPAGGIAIGEKWSDSQAIDDAPLLGTVLRGESTYLRNEPCRAQASQPAPAGSVEEICAVILTRTTRAQLNPRRDPTPPEYRQRDLRTAGRWSGSGESLTLVSLRSGWVVSATQSGSEDFDYTVTTADGRKIRNFGKVQTQSNILLLP